MSTVAPDGRREQSGLPKERVLMRRLQSALSFVCTFVFLFALWLVLSGKFEPLLLGLGLLASFLVAFFFHDLLFPGFHRSYFLSSLRFFGYIPWLILEIFKANFHLLRLVFHPRIHDLIDPHIVSIRTGLCKDMSIVTMANSITLTPGTITVTANSEGHFTVHAIDRKSSRTLPGEMLNKVAAVFGDEVERIEK